MTVHQINIYHCQKCGKVLSREQLEKTPECCGSPMAPAVENITYENSSSKPTSIEEVVRKSHRQKG